MIARTRRAIAAGSSIAIVGAALVGAIAFGNMANAAPKPEPMTVSVPASELVDVDAAIAELEAARAEAARIEAERVEAERVAAEAARVEAERVAAEQAAAEQAARQETPPAPSVPVAPPAAPNPGDQQAGECREYNEANECTGWYVP